MAQCPDKMNAQAHAHTAQASALAELGAMASLYAHEMNNLLTHLSGRAQLALMHPDDGELSRHALQAVQDACVRAQELARLFLDPGGGAPSDEPPVRCTMRQILDRVRAGLRAGDRSRFGLDLDDETHGFVPDAMPIVLEQVLHNLVLNAIRAIEEHPDPDAPHHRIRIRAHCSTWNTTDAPAIDADEAHDHIMSVEVEDTGVGLSARQVEQLNAGQPIDAPESARLGSLPRHGLGLRVCRKLLTTAGGTLQCVSTPNRGTRFIIRIPALRVERRPVEAAA